MWPERRNSEPRLHKSDALWINERRSVLQTLSELPHEKQVEFFQFAEQKGGAVEQEAGGRACLSKAVSAGGKMTGEQVECALATLEHALTHHHIAQCADRKTLSSQAREEWRDHMMTFAFTDARWRVPISQTPLRVREMLERPPDGSAFDYRPQEASEPADIGFCPALPLTPDELFVWVTESACEEISYAVAEAEHSLLSADMFPAEAATLVFHTPVLDTTIVSAGAMRWRLDEYEGSEVVWVTTSAPWSYPDELKYQQVYCIPLGHVCEPYDDFMFVTHPDRLLWAVLQLTQTPLSARPKAERSDMRRADKRALSRGREATGDRMQVIDLRRPRHGESVSEEDRHVRAHWARGHMRRQWWPTLDQHVPRWIQTHVRGNHELGWAPGHSHTGPPKRDTVWRLRGDEDV